MTIRTKFEIVVNDDQLNQGFFNGIVDYSARPLLLNTITQLENRSITFSQDGGMFAEAYVDSNGQLDSIDASNTTATYDSVNKKYYAFIDNSGSDTTANVSTTNPENFFDDDVSTYANYTVNTSASVITSSLGKTFSSKDVGLLIVTYRLFASGANFSSWSVKLQTYNGSVWSDFSTLDSGSSDFGMGSITTSVVNVNSTIQGIRLLMTSDGVSSSTNHLQYYYEMSYGDSDESVVVHNIPSGTFSSTYKNGFATAKVSDWETGANIQFKLTNATEDTGYGDYNKILSASTAFTSEPTKFWVKLVPKTTSPTSGFPSVNGSGIIGDK